MTRDSNCLVAVLCPLVCGACSLPAERTGFQSDDPQERTQALGTAARLNDQRSIPELIGLLQSADAAQRMLAIRSLEHMTGQTLGYDYAAPEWERAAAVGRWVEWQDAREPRSSVPVRSSGG